MGAICLQGGAEFQPGCESMDAALLALPGPDRGPRRVLVAPFAGRPGREREIAGANAERWYRGLGAQDVVVVHDEGGPFADELSRAGRQDASEVLLVLPGGSPIRLLQALTPHVELLRAVHRAGLVISGASAGAMVLCGWTVLPGGALRVARGLGLVPVDLVLVHFRGQPEGPHPWLDAARDALPPDPVVLGLPERSGAVVGAAGSWTQAGVDPVVVLAG